MRWESHVVSNFWEVSSSGGSEEFKRLFHTSHLVDDMVYIFGGTTIDEENREHILDSFVTYNFSSGNIQKLRLDIPALTQHSMTYCELFDGKQFFYIYGGKTHQGVQNSLFRFDIQKQIVQQITTKGKPPSRYGHTATLIHSNTLCIIGGTDGNKYHCDIHLLDLETLQWTAVKPSGGFASREGHSTILYGNLLYLFGGGNDNKIFNDLYTIDIEKWKITHVIPSSSLQPSQRINHSMNLIGNKIIIFGGSGRGLHSEVYEFDLEKTVWKHEHIQDKGHNPPCLYGHSSLIENQKIWIFGGRSSNDTLSEGFIYSLDTEFKFLVETHPIPKSDLLEDLYNIMNVKEHSDLIIYVGDALFYAHQSMIMIRAPLLYKLIVNGKIQLDDYFECFEYFLEYLYTDRILEIDSLDKNIKNQLLDLSKSFEITRLTCLVKEDTLSQSTLAQDMCTLLKETKYADVFFEGDTEQVFGHKWVLIARCNMTLLDEIRVKTEILKMLMEYLYTGNVKISFDHAIELMIAAENVGIDRLSTMCQNLIQRKFNVYNVSRILSISDEYDVPNLRKNCISFIMNHFNQVKKTNGFKGMDKEIKLELKELKKNVNKRALL